MNFIRRCKRVAYKACGMKQAFCQSVRGPFDLPPTIAYKLRGSAQYRQQLLTSVIDSKLQLSIERLGGTEQMEYMFLLLDGYTRQGSTEIYNPGDLASAYKSDPCTQTTEALLVYCSDFKRKQGLFVSIPYCYADDGLPTFSRGLAYHLEASEVLSRVQHLLNNNRLAGLKQDLSASQTTREEPRQR